MVGGSASGFRASGRGWFRFEDDFGFRKAWGSGELRVQEEEPPFSQRPRAPHPPEPFLYTYDIYGCTYLHEYIYIYDGVRHCDGAQAADATHSLVRIYIYIYANFEFRRKRYLLLSALAPRVFLNSSIDRSID